jgi:hypothetical protein
LFWKLLGWGGLLLSVKDNIFYKTNIMTWHPVEGRLHRDTSDRQINLEEPMKKNKITTTNKQESSNLVVNTTLKETKETRKGKDNEGIKTFCIHSTISDNNKNQGEERLNSDATVLIPSDYDSSD